MRLTVRHETVYRYSEAVAYAIQTLRLTPRPHDGLAVLRWSVAAETPKPLPEFVDGFGNLVHCHATNRPHISATVLVDGEVETRDTYGVVSGAPEPLPPLFYLNHTPLTAASTAIAALEHEGARGADPLARMTALMDAVRARLGDRAGPTNSAIAADAALAIGAGVCQDHAHVFIAAARALGVPARYVGGYLWTGEDRQDHEASHAWAEAWLDGIGWVGFDPSNRTRPTACHIRTAVGLDYWSAAPVRGIRRGPATATLAVKVQVVRTGADQ
ncbi:MAG TPA: transglutaminase family protein [Stellaceae bacterium]|nr:transglutaminase family protein [Stellaceae bacterium]